MRNLETVETGQLTSARAAEQIERLQQAVETVIKGKPEAIRLAIVTLIAGGMLCLPAGLFTLAAPQSIWVRHWVSVTQISWSMLFGRSRVLLPFTSSRSSCIVTPWPALHADPEHQTA